MRRPNWCFLCAYCYVLRKQEVCMLLGHVCLYNQRYFLFRNNFCCNVYWIRET